MPRLENWSMVAVGSYYNPPELTVYNISGNIYNHPNSDRFYDGKVVTTGIKTINTDGSFVSFSGNIYTLGKVSSEYKEYYDSLISKPEGDFKPIYDLIKKG